MRTSIKQLALGVAIAGAIAVGGVGMANAQTDEPATDTETTVVADDTGTDAPLDTTEADDVSTPVDRPDHGRGGPGGCNDADGATVSGDGAEASDDTGDADVTVTTDAPVEVEVTPTPTVAETVPVDSSDL